MVVFVLMVVVIVRVESMSSLGFEGPVLPGRPYNSLYLLLLNVDSIFISMSLLTRGRLLAGEFQDGRALPLRGLPRWFLEGLCSAFLQGLGLAFFVWVMCSCCSHASLDEFHLM